MQLSTETILQFWDLKKKFREQIAGNFEVKFRGRLGPGKEDDRAIRILNRVVHWDGEGIKYEPDQRHAEIITKQLGINNKKSAVSPGVKPSNEKDEEGDDEELGGEYTTKYRALTARGNYLAQDRSDIRFAVKELSRRMARPRRRDWRRLVRL